HERAVKERFLFLYSVIILLAVLLSLVLNSMAAGPLNRLYLLATKIVADDRKEGITDSDALLRPGIGEIGIICQAIQRLVKAQKTQADNFRAFSSDIVHELKTPLSAIRSGIEIYSETPDEKEKGEILERIHTRISRMESLMDEIKHIGELETQTENEYCDSVLPVIREALRAYESRGVLFEHSGGTEKCRLPVSGVKLYQVVDNLVKNAVDFSPVRESVRVSADINEGLFVLSVRDKGPGILKEVFPLVTTRFFSYRMGENVHSGLGLAIVDAIARNSGGNLVYRNLDAGGSMFTVSFPLA
ncbi:MAG: HAMP domain-containing histidine kinase, partial [Spirochaetales bacterium]|nr:HAMP domain-containing histidine kinase [Spirochaetales bacterium]